MQNRDISIDRSLWSRAHRFARGTIFFLGRVVNSAGVFISVVMWRHHTVNGRCGVLWEKGRSGDELCF